MGTQSHTDEHRESSNTGRSATEQNRAYYDQELAGKDDYWRKMAAPRFRVREFLRLLDVEPFFRLCDLGCGGGQLLREIAEHHPRAALCGVDLAETQIAANRRQIPSAQFFAMDLDQPAARFPAAGRFASIAADDRQAESASARFAAVAGDCQRVR